VVHSNLFESVDGRFDVIVFDPPFRWFTPRDALETAIADENYTSLTQFIRTARDYLSDRGRVLIHFGTSADVTYLDELIESERFSKEELSRYELRVDWTVSYFVLRLVPLKDDG
jgi:release factor glutamine methyltransferase